MFAEYLYEFVGAEFARRLLLIDSDGLDGKTGFSEFFARQGFQVIAFTDDLHFRVDHDDAMTDDNGKYLVIADNNTYAPYDVRMRFRCQTISCSVLFSKLDTETLLREPDLQYDLLADAYRSSYIEQLDKVHTEQYLREIVFGRQNVERYLHKETDVLCVAAKEAKSYKDWIRIAVKKAELDRMAVSCEIEQTDNDIQEQFKLFVLCNYEKLSSQIDRDTPVLVCRAMEYMHDNSRKFAVVVMDGMSLFDWKTLSRSLQGMQIRESCAFAMIPTTTSISRQCLLSGKFPSQLMEPWKQSKEKQEFTECAAALGYTSNQISYARGYDAEFGIGVQCAAIIINDVDDMVHSQMQGRVGMLQDMRLLSRQGKLTRLVRRLIDGGFEVYITADHGNTPCIGMGKLINTGVEMETKSRRMLVTRDIADKQKWIDQYAMIEYPKYYLDKAFNYLICPAGRSLDTKGDDVMSHGGMTIEEVIVPFILIKAEENHG